MKILTTLGILSLLIISLITSSACIIELYNYIQHTNQNSYLSNIVNNPLGVNLMFLFVSVYTCINTFYLLHKFLLKNG